MSGLLGSGVKDTNSRFSFFVIIAMGIFAFGVIISWRSVALVSAEYQDLPTTHAQVQIKKQNSQKQNIFLKNYRIDE